MKKKHKGGEEGACFERSKKSSKEGDLKNKKINLKKFRACACFDSRKEQKRKNYTLTSQGFAHICLHCSITTRRAEWKHEIIVCFRSCKERDGKIIKLYMS